MEMDGSDNPCMASGPVACGAGLLRSAVAAAISAALTERSASVGPLGIACVLVVWN